MSIPCQRYPCSRGHSTDGAGGRGSVRKMRGTVHPNVALFLAQSLIYACPYVLAATPQGFGLNVNVFLNFEPNVGHLSTAAGTASTLRY